MQIAISQTSAITPPMGMVAAHAPGRAHRLGLVLRAGAGGGVPARCPKWPSGKALLALTSPSEKLV